MKSGKKVIRVALAILCMVSMLFISEYQKVEVYAASGYGFIFLSAYEKTLKTGDTYCLSVVSSGSKKPTFTSSDSKVASVVNRTNHKVFITLSNSIQIGYPPSLITSFASIP